MLFPPARFSPLHPPFRASPLHVESGRGGNLPGGKQHGGLFGAGTEAAGTPAPQPPRAAALRVAGHHSAAQRPPTPGLGAGSGRHRLRQLPRARTVPPLHGVREDAHRNHSPPPPCATTPAGGGARWFCGGAGGHARSAPAKHGGGSRPRPRFSRAISAARSGRRTGARQARPSGAPRTRLGHTRSNRSPVPLCCLCDLPRVAVAPRRRRLWIPYQFRFVPRTLRLRHAVTLGPRRVQPRSPLGRREGVPPRRRHASLSPAHALAPP